MSTSVGVNVLRYSALGLGVVYGFSHQRTIYSAQKTEALHREYEHQQSLIRQAKAEYARLHAPPSATSSVVTDPSDPKFDIEAFFGHLLKQAA